MHYALANITRWLPMPASVATSLYDTYPEYRDRLLINAAIPVEAWSQLDTKSVGAANLADMLKRDIPSLCSHICESTDRRATVISTVMNNWALPLRLQEQIVSRRLSKSTTSEILNSAFEDRYKLRVAGMKTADRVAVIDWLATNPDISDDDYLDVVRSVNVDFRPTAVTLMAQRPGLARRLVIERDEQLLSAAAVVIEPGDELERLAFWLVDQPHSSIVPSVAFSLLERFDVPERIASMLAKHLHQFYPEHVPTWADIVKVNDPRRSSRALYELDATDAVALVDRLVNLTVYYDRISRWWQLAVLILRDDLPTDVLLRALRYIPSRLLNSGFFDGWHDSHTESYLYDISQTVISWRGYYDMRRRVRHRERLAEARALARSTTEPIRTRRDLVDEIAIEPTDEIIPVEKAGIAEVGSPKLKLGMGVSASNLARYLVEHLGDATDETSAAAWRTAFRLIEVAPDGRTLAEIMRAVEAITTT